MDRVLAAARLHTVRPLATIGLTWLIVLAVTVVNVIVWRTTPQDGAAGSGAVVVLAIVVLITHVQTVTQLLPFGMGMGISRRSFFAGTALAIVLLAAAYGLALTALARIERATGGWGVNLAFFAPPWVDASNSAAQWLAFSALLLLASALGTGIGIVYKRFGATGLYVSTVATILVVGGIVALIGRLDAWQSVGAWLADQPLMVLAVALPAVLTVAITALSFVGLRRVVP